MNLTAKQQQQKTKTDETYATWLAEVSEPQLIGVPALNNNCYLNIDLVCTTHTCMYVCDQWLRQIAKLAWISGEGMRQMFMNVERMNDSYIPINK